MATTERHGVIVDEQGNEGLVVTPLHQRGGHHQDAAGVVAVVHRLLLARRHATALHLPRAPAEYVRALL